MVIAIPSFSCLAVLAALTFLECSASSPPLYSVQPFLAGEDTPVWLADRPDHTKPVIYTMLESGLVKKAIKYWYDLQAANGFPVRKPRMFNISNSLQDHNPNQIHLYPTMLLVVDYDHFSPITNDNQEKTIKERIIYALAFWYSVDYDLQHIKEPHVHLRISGIIMTRNRKASPYINNDEYYSSLVDSLTPMLDYWTKLGNINEHFILESYDIIAHMTDSHPYRDAGYSMYPGIASTSNPCVMKDGHAGVIVYDDLAFLGIHTAVEKMTNVFGDNSVSWKQYTFGRKQWTPTTLTNIRNGLKTGHCMSAPKEYYSPGKPVLPILAGFLLPRAKQCEAHGFNAVTYHCWNTDFWGLVTSNCDSLRCSNSRTSITCKYSNPTLDGTFCDARDEKMCMAGECVFFQ